MKLEDLQIKAQRLLEECQEEIEQVRSEWEKEYVLDLRDSSIEETLKELKSNASNTKVLYSFEVTKTQDSLKILNEYQEHKNGQEKKLAISRMPKEYSETKCLYVGSSNNFPSRFRNHLGVCNSTSTYSLHLKKVLKDNYNLKLRVISLNNASERAKQLLEDALWEKLNPLFGKKGGK